VTWRITEPAGPGYFIAGDAAAAVDPASSHGILRAILSGIMAGSFAARTIRHRIDEATAARCYKEWVSRLFNHDVTRLREMYTRLSLAPTWGQKSQETSAL
jgi:flavin-dependent dehydrogenase